MMIAVAGCADPAPPPVQVAGKGMPQLVRRPLVIREEDRPESYYVTFGVSASGEIAFMASESHAPVVRVVDSTGALVAAFGEIGEGPGELGYLLHLSFRTDTIWILEGDGASTLVETNLKGDVLRTRGMGTNDIVLAWHGDSIDHLTEGRHASPGIADGRRVLRSAIGENGGRLLADSTNAVLAAAVAQPPGYRTISFPYAATTDRFWIADGWNYRIGVFASDGRPLYDFVHDIPPNSRGPRALKTQRERLEREPKFLRGPNGQAIRLPDQTARLDTLERERTPHFAHRPLHVDHTGRLWVVGPSRDSTTVDVFTAGTFLGRAVLPCYSSGLGVRAALGRGWLVLECEIDDSDWPTELQLYRIVER